MRMGLLIVGLALVGIWAAQANDLVITSFDGTGRLTFQEVSTAASYRVEWATKLIAPTWSSNAPGIAAVPASAGHANSHRWRRSCGVLLPSGRSGDECSPGCITNTFDLSSENWLTVSHPFRSHSANPETEALPFDGTSEIRPAVFGSATSILKPA